MKIKFLAIVMVFTSVATFSQKTAASPSQKKVVAATDGIFAEIETNKGKIVLDLNYKKTPVTVANFISLAEGTNPDVNPKYKGKPFYDGIKFHRVIKDFMIQTGDPLGTGAGDPGYKFKDEITDLKHDVAGILSMANSGPNTNGSQFFITHKETPWLDGKHTVFGKVVSGMEVVNSIEQNDVMTKVTIVRKGAEAKKFNAVKVFTAANEADKIAAQKEAKERELKNAQALKEFEGGKTTASGLKYVIIKEGTGEKISIKLKGRVFSKEHKNKKPVSDLNTETDSMSDKKKRKLRKENKRKKILSYYDKIVFFLILLLLIYKDHLNFVHEKYVH